MKFITSVRQAASQCRDAAWIEMHSKNWQRGCMVSNLSALSPISMAAFLGCDNVFGTAYLFQLMLTKEDLTDDNRDAAPGWPALPQALEE
jgi:hypothetical protein